MTRLRDIADILSGLLPPKGDGTDAAYVQIKDLREPEGGLPRGPAPSVRRATRIRPSDLLVPTRGEELAAFRPGPHMVGAYIGLDVYLVRPNPSRIDPDFLFVTLNDIAVVRQLKASATAGALPRIPKQALEDVVLSLPALDQQRRIGRLAKLASDCERISRARAAAETRLHAAIISQMLKIAA